MAARKTKKPSLRKTKTDAAEKAPKKEKVAKVYASEVPDFVYEDEVEYDAPIVDPTDAEQIGTVLMTKDPENEKKRALPVRFARNDFPKTLEGELAWWDYKIAIAEFKKAQAVKRGDPLKRQKAKLSRMMEAVELLKKKIASEAGDEDDGDDTEE